MKYFAKISDVANSDGRFPVIKNVLVEDGEASNYPDPPWKEASYTGEIRKHFPGKEYELRDGVMVHLGSAGFTYDPIKDWFVPPQPYPSWLLDENANWQPPTPMPSDGKDYRWSEPTLSWVER